MEIRCSNILVSLSLSTALSYLQVSSGSLSLEGKIIVRELRVSCSSLTLTPQDVATVSVQRMHLSKVKDLRTKIKWFPELKSLSFSLSE